MLRKITNIITPIILTTLIIVIVYITVDINQTPGNFDLSQSSFTENDIYTTEFIPEQTAIIGENETPEHSEKRKVGKLIPKATAAVNETDEITEINGVEYYKNFVPDDIDINSLDPSSYYVSAMVKRYFEDSATERELKALITISQKADGLFVNHPKHGFIDLGKQIMMDLNIQEAGESETDENENEDEEEYKSRFRVEYLINKFSDNKISEDELAELKILCEEKGIRVHGLHLYFMSQEIQDMYDWVKGRVDISITIKHDGGCSTKYISVEDYAVLKEAYDRELEQYNESLRNQQVITSFTVPFEYTEEEMIIEDANSPYLHFLIALYLDGKINDEEKALLFEACELFGIDINKATKSKAN
ncbi:MAG: hypothetical protein AB9835_12780 [Eubacteriales bacterium]